MHYPNLHDDVFTASLFKLNGSSFEWKNLQKSTSPHLKCELNGVAFSAIIDSGAELNVMDKDLAQRLNIGIINSHQLAVAANRTPLDVQGQTSSPVSVECITTTGTKMINLGILLNVANLGTDCLLGEPAKQTNNIIFVCLVRNLSC